MVTRSHYRVCKFDYLIRRVSDIMGINEIFTETTTETTNINNGINIRNVELELSMILNKFGRDSELTKRVSETFSAVVELHKELNK